MTKKQVKNRMVQSARQKVPVKQQAARNSGGLSGTAEPMEIGQKVVRKRGRPCKVKKGPVGQKVPPAQKGPVDQNGPPGQEGPPAEEGELPIYETTWKVIREVFAPAATKDTHCSLKIAENKKIKEEKEAAERTAKGLGPKPADPPVYDVIYEPETDSNPGSGSEDSEPEEEQAGPGPSSPCPASMDQENLQRPTRSPGPSSKRDRISGPGSSCLAPRDQENLQRPSRSPARRDRTPGSSGPPSRSASSSRTKRDQEVGRGDRAPTRASRSEARRDPNGPTRVYEGPSSRSSSTKRDRIPKLLRKARDPVVPIDQDAEAELMLQMAPVVEAAPDDQDPEEYELGKDPTLVRFAGFRATPPRHSGYSRSPRRRNQWRTRQIRDDLVGPSAHEVQSDPLGDDVEMEDVQILSPPVQVDQEPFEDNVNMEEEYVGSDPRFHDDQMFPEAQIPSPPVQVDQEPTGDDVEIEEELVGSAPRSPEDQTVPAAQAQVPEVQIGAPPAQADQIVPAAQSQVPDVHIPPPHAPQGQGAVVPEAQELHEDDVEMEDEPVGSAPGSPVAHRAPASPFQVPEVQTPPQPVQEGWMVPAAQEPHGDTEMEAVEALMALQGQGLARADPQDPDEDAQTAQEDHMDSSAQQSLEVIETRDPEVPIDVEEQELAPQVAEPEADPLDQDPADPLAQEDQTVPPAEMAHGDDVEVEDEQVGSAPMFPEDHVQSPELQIPAPPVPEAQELHEDDVEMEEEPVGSPPRIQEDQKDSPAQVPLAPFQNESPEAQNAIEEQGVSSELSGPEADPADSPAQAPVEEVEMRDPEAGSASEEQGVAQEAVGAQADPPVQQQIEEVEAPEVAGARAVPQDQYPNDPRSEENQRAPPAPPAVPQEPPAQPPLEAVQIQAPAAPMAVADRPGPPLIPGLPRARARPQKPREPVFYDVLDPQDYEADPPAGRTDAVRTWTCADVSEWFDGIADDTARNVVQRALKIEGVDGGSLQDYFLTDPNANRYEIPNSQWRRYQNFVRVAINRSRQFHYERTLMEYERSQLDRAST
ncbi:unnamed protein product [Caenorhabditis sp. 36 PRJEB53466]|nr:unnamed protein product [Caenorhabditis sp. 36 PRJEB53466]